MGKLDSIFSRKITLYREYYQRNMVGFTFSAANLISLFVWFLIIVVPFIVAFTSGGK